MYLRLVAFVQFLPISHFSVLLSSKFLHSFHFSHVRTLPTFRPVSGESTYNINLLVPSIPTDFQSPASLILAVFPTAHFSILALPPFHRYSVSFLSKYPSPLRTRATVDFPPPLSLSKPHFPLLQSIPTNPRPPPTRCFLPSSASLSLAHDPPRWPPPPPLAEFLSRFIPLVCSRTDRRSLSRRWSRCLSPTPCSAESVRLPTSGAVDSHPPCARNSSRCQPRYHRLFHDSGETP